MAGECLRIHRHPHTHSCHPNDFTDPDFHLWEKIQTIQVVAADEASPVRAGSQRINSITEESDVRIAALAVAVPVSVPFNRTRQRIM